jgi:hypothetical protein
MSQSGRNGPKRTECISSSCGTPAADGRSSGRNGRHPIGASFPSSVLLCFRDEAEADLFEERAAIREFDAGLPRDAAERLAWADVLQGRQPRRPPVSNPTPKGGADHG